MGNRPVLAKYIQNVTFGDKIARIPLLSILRRLLSGLFIDDRLIHNLIVNRIPPVPIPIIHGTDDCFVPYHNGRMSFDAAIQPKEFVALVGGIHTDAFVHPESVYRDILVRFYLSALYLFCSKSILCKLKDVREFCFSVWGSR